MRAFTLSVIVSLSIVFSGLALAAEPVSVFEPGGTKPVPAAFKAWHPQFEKDGDYGESWFFLVQTSNNAVLFAMVSITNLALKTFDGRIDAMFYPPDGKLIRFYKELSRSDVHASATSLEVTIGGAHVWGRDDAYHMTIDDPKFAMKLDVEGLLPSLMFGDGAVAFGKDKSDVWTIGINVPYGKATGSVKAGGISYDLAGSAYHDHGYATVKLPDVIQKWQTLRVYDPKLALLLHDQTLTKKYGSKHNRFGTLGAGGKSYPLRDFEFTPKTFRKHSAGYQIPTEFEVSAKGGGYSVAGTVTESKFLDAVDVLGQVSWAIRTLIKAFYSNPYMYRYLGMYEFDATAPDGTTEHVSGLAVVEANYF